MDSAVVAALACSRSLSSAQLQGVVTAVAVLRPRLLLELAGRDDLNDDVRTHLLREAPAYLVIDLLKVWPPDLGLVKVATEVHGVLPDLVVLCGDRGWVEHAADLAGQVGWTDVQQVAHRWSEHGPGEIPDSVRISLVDAALTEREPRPKLSSLTEWEQRELLDRLHEERTARARIAWSLLEQRQELWAELAQHGAHAMQVRRILLEYPDELADDVLLACLPEVLSEQLRDKEYMAGIRLQSAAGHVRRWPRLRQIATQELERLVREVVDGGWTPQGEFGRPDWNGITALAELSNDTQLLTAAVTTTQTAEPSRYKTSESLKSWFDERAAAVAALTMNPDVPRSDLIALVPTLDEHALEAAHRHSDGALKSACQEQLAQRREAAAQQRPRFVEVPDDDELAEHDDPAAVLHAHLKHLKGRAAQRDLTIDGLLRSRFTTPEILRALAAARVLDSAEQAERVAALLAAACGDDHLRWSALPTHCDPPPARAVTFGAWLDRLKSA